MSDENIIIEIITDDVEIFEIVTEQIEIVELYNENIIIEITTDDVEIFEIVTEQIEIVELITEGLPGKKGDKGDKGEGSVLEKDIISMLDVGAIAQQDLIAEGTTFTAFIEQLLTTTFFPTINPPNIVLTVDIANNIEAGYIQTATLTANFSRGSINGKMVDGVWQPSTFQDYRAGTVDYYVIDGSIIEVNTKTLTDYQVVDGNNTWTASTYYLIGTQPKDSAGEDYLTPLPAGNITTSKTIYGQRNCFYGVSNSALTSVDIRALDNNILNPTNGSVFTINIPIGATNVVFAYPATLQTVSSVKYVEGLNAEIKSVFDLTTVSVEGLNNYLGIDYKVYIYNPVEPFSDIATYSVII